MSGIGAAHESMHAIVHLRILHIPGGNWDYCPFEGIARVDLSDVRSGAVLELNFLGGPGQNV